MLSGLKEDKPLPSISDLVGEYTTWNYLWSYSLAPHGVNATRVVVDNFGNVYTTQTYAATGLVTIDYNGNGTFYVNDGLLEEWFVKGYSVDNKFVCGFDIPVANHRLTVWRYGARIFVRDPKADDANFNTFVDIMMSPNGRFIVFSAWSLATGVPDLVMLYEGA